MGTIYPGRYTAQMEGTVVVFIIGVRINRLLSVHKWLPVVQAMGPMLQELYKNPDLGFLHSTYHFNLRGVTLVQYWRSVEQLEHYARHGQQHLTAWRDFHRKVGSNPTVGVFHETYVVPERGYESVYNNMPVYGLAQAGEHVPVSGSTDTARQRMERN